MQTAEWMIAKKKQKKQPSWLGQFVIPEKKTKKKHSRQNKEITDLYHLGRNT